MYTKIHVLYQHVYTYIHTETYIDAAYLTKIRH